MYFLQETVRAITEMKKSAAEGGKPEEVKFTETIASTFLSYVARELTSHPVYPSICHFKGVLSEAMGLAGEQLDANKQKELLLICSLADIGTGS